MPLIATYVVKILGTVTLWCIPLMMLPLSIFQGLEVPVQTILPLRLLGWAYLVLCIGYGMGLLAALQGRYEPIPVVVGIFSNGGAAVLLIYMLLAELAPGNGWVQLHLWVSAIAALAITCALILFGRVRN